MTSKIGIPSSGLVGQSGGGSGTDLVHYTRGNWTYSNGGARAQGFFDSDADTSTPTNNAFKASVVSKDQTLTYFAGHVFSNTKASDLTITLYVDNVPTSLTFVVTGSGTGVFSGTGSVPVTRGQVLHMQGDAVAGTTTFTSIVCI